MRLIPYTEHRKSEEQFRVHAKALDEQQHPNATELKATALNKLRADQKLDALVCIAGYTVHVYRGSELVGIARHCVVGYATATVCFILEERNDDGAIVKQIEVTGDMDIFVERPHG